MPVEEKKSKILYRPLVLLNNNYGDFIVYIFVLFQIVSVADHSGNLRLGMKSDRERENDYQEQFGKNNIKSPTMVPIQYVMQEPLLQFLQLRSRLEFGIQYITRYCLKTQYQGQQPEGDYPLRRSAGTPSPSAYIILLFNGSYSTS